jgi:hypothetical protein
VGRLGYIDRSTVGSLTYFEVGMKLLISSTSVGISLSGSSFMWALAYRGISLFGWNGKSYDVCSVFVLDAVVSHVYHR